MALKIFLTALLVTAILNAVDNNLRKDKPEYRGRQGVIGIMAASFVTMVISGLVYIWGAS